MAKDGTAMTLPRLRFPEFRYAKAWDRTPLGRAFLRITNGKANAQDHEEGGTYPLFDRSEVIKASNSFAFSAEAVILPGEGVAFTPRYFDGKFNLHQRAYALMDCQGHAKYFLFALDHAKDDLADKAVKSTVLSLRMPIIEKFAVCTPDRHEQKKIGDCLTSLDEVIAAQRRKVEALRAHKRGLMQQLFPREGETRPRLRFPEFLNAPEWEEAPLKSLATYQNGKAYEQDIVEKGRFVVVNSRFISTDGAVRKHTNAEYCTAIRGDVLMVLSDLPNGRALAKCFLVDADDRYAVNQRVARLTPTDVESVFLFYRLNRSPQLLKFDDGLTQTHLSKGDVQDCLLWVPREQKEQQRIADCLSSLDTRISAESNQLTALKVHKQGLMQQLFPVPESVRA